LRVDDYFFIVQIFFGFVGPLIFRGLRVDDGWLDGSLNVEETVVEVNRYRGRMRVLTSTHALVAQSPFTIISVSKRSEWKDHTYIQQQAFASAPNYYPADLERMESRADGMPSSSPVCGRM
jgi:hypothetical protein